MIHRCHNPGSVSFKDYGGRGIKVCARWQESFENFLADVGQRPSGMTLDRINTNGNYEPGNVWWATRRQQHHNRRNGKPGQRDAACGVAALFPSNAIEHETPKRKPKRWLDRRSRLLTKALEAAGLTKTEFCAAGKYSRHHVNEVVLGRRRSYDVDVAIAALIERQLGVKV